MGCFRPSGHLAFASGRPQGWDRGLEEVLEKTAGRQEACASLPRLLVFQKSVLCESRTLNNGELLSCCRLCLSEKQEASSASKLPVLQLCSPSSVRKEQIVRHVRGTQRTTKLSLPVRKIFEAVSDLLLPSVSWQPVYAAEGRPVTLLRLRLRTNKECTLTQATQVNMMKSIKTTGQRSQKPAFISETSSDM